MRKCVCACVRAFVRALMCVCARARAFVCVRVRLCAWELRGTGILESGSSGFKGLDDYYIKTYNCIYVFIV